MARYVLKDDGYPTFKKIVSGRKWIGRVCKTEFGYYLGIIGSTTVKGATEREAFDNVIAKHCGFASPAALDQNNRQVQQTNKARSRAARFVVNEMVRGNFEPLDKMLGWSEGKDKDGS